MKIKISIKKTIVIILSLILAIQFTCSNIEQVSAATSISLYSGEKLTSTSTSSSSTSSTKTYYLSYASGSTYKKTVTSTTTYADTKTYYSSSMKIVSKVKITKKTYSYTRGSRKYTRKTVVTTKTTTKKYSLPSKSIKLGTTTGTKIQSWLIDDFYAEGGKFYLDPDLSNIFSEKPKSGIIGSTLWSSRGTKIAVRRLYNFTNDTTVYHEMGHYLDFTAQALDCKYNSETSSFQSIYKAEKNNFVGYNKKYCTQNACEYFGQCYAEYMLHGTTLKKYCPKTYAYIANTLSAVKKKVTSAPKFTCSASTLVPKKTYYIKFSNTNGKIFTKWESSDEGIMKISQDGHYVQAISPGTVTITGTIANGKKVSYQLKVEGEENLSFIQEQGS